MSKFKIGDKVRVTYGWALGTVGTIKRYVDNGRFVIKANEKPNHSYYEDEGDNWCFHSADDLVELVIEQPRREFIVIRRSGAETIAELRHDREVIKSAKATCAPSDTFDFETGAKIAFDRMMGREAKPITGKSFDRIFVDDIAPAPEPPKFYTGKVFAVNPKPESVDDPDITIRNNRVYEIKNGYVVGDRCGLVQLNQPYKSFQEFADDKYSTEWREVKEPSDV